MQISYESFFTIIRIVEINKDCVFCLHQLLHVYFVLAMQNTELFLQDISRFLFSTWSNNVSLPSFCLVACNLFVWRTTSVFLYHYFIVQLLWINTSPKSGYVHSRKQFSSLCVNNRGFSRNLIWSSAISFWEWFNRVPLTFLMNFHLAHGHHESPYSYFVFCFHQILSWYGTKYDIAISATITVVEAI